MDDSNLKTFDLKQKLFLGAPLEKPCIIMMGKYCRFVARHPTPFIIFPILATTVLSSSIIFKFEIVRDVHYLYTPINSQWKFEDQIFKDGWANNDDQFYPGKDVFRRTSIYLLVEATDGDNILRKSHASQFIELLDWIVSEVFFTDDGLPYTYRNICLQYGNECFENRHARFVADIFQRGDQSRFNVTYPLFKSQFSTEPIDLSQTLGGVELDSRQRIQSAKAWVILYQLQQGSSLCRKLSFNYEYILSKRIEEKSVPVTLLNLYIFHSNTFEIELAEGSRQIAPRFIYTFVLLIIFSVLCTFNVAIVPISKSSKSVLVIDWLLSKPLLGLVGVFVTLLAILSATGSLLLLNVPFVDVATMMPFLSLTVGIDDTFLILAAWHSTNAKLSVEDRIEKSMRHAAVSIAITSITDTAAFLIGSIAPLPAVTYFCYYSAAAIVFTFVYLLSAFVAFLAILGQCEKAQRNNLFYVKTIPFSKYESVSSLQRIFNMGGWECKHCNTSKSACFQQVNNTEKNCDNSKMDTWYLGYRRIIGRYYASMIMSKLVQTATIIFFIAYLAAAIVGVQKLEIGFDMTNLLRDNSSSKKFLELREKFFEHTMPTLEIAVMKPPNMGRKSQRLKFLQVLEEFEGTACSIGRNTTEFWLFAYEHFMDDLGFGGELWNNKEDNQEEFEQNLQPFLLANEKYRHDILLHDNGSIRAFRLFTNIADISTSCTKLIIQCAKVIRMIAKKYEAQYNISTYSALWPLADQLSIIWPQTLQDLYISIAVIIPISLLLIPQPLCAILISLTVISIALGVIGFMSFWDVNLDATSMITIAMSVGFSVDFAIHTTYGYISYGDRQKQKTSMPIERLRGTLETVGWPVIQASTSVLLGILPLATLNSYVVQTCFKTVLLIIIIGALHALLFLPLFLMQIHTFYLWIHNFSDVK